ncbi:hypothetical protein BU15DRAFT_88188 [Melanogaster broomeanus]|nr:hypothetical protein BU15DRAFT_88188 [Melanogaster broomeanus]
MKLPTEDERKACYCAFIEATSNTALSQSVCVLYPRDGHVSNPEHLQHGMAGNVTLYNMNTEAIIEMLEGQLLPQPAAQLASVLAITYIGSKKLPKSWLKSTFRANNEVYQDIVISSECICCLPEDDIPFEMSAVIRHENDKEVAVRERAGYVPIDDSEQDGDSESHLEGNVIPLQYLGVSDMELDQVSLDECMKFALANMQGSEGGYVVRHGLRPVSEFGTSRHGGHQPAPKQNPLAAAYPILFPYGIGGVEMEREHTALLSAHIQMNRRDFELADLKEAEKEEAAHMSISNPQVNSRGPLLWLTINPFLAGEQIDMDKFNAKLGPDNPYAAAKYFFFSINTILRTLFGINTTKDQVHTCMGLIGRICAYFGTLHIHMLLWLENTPNAEQMHRLLESSDFRQHMCKYIKVNICAHVDGLDDASINTMPCETQLAYSRPLNPDDCLRHVVHSQQIHTCTQATCLHYNKHGHLVCKCQIDSHGRYKPHHTMPFINNFCPPISVTLYTKDSKKQAKNHNVSALMADLLFILDRNQLLIFHCQHMSAPQVIAFVPIVMSHFTGHLFKGICNQYSMNSDHSETGVS